jgi:Zn-dependent protease
MLGMPNVDRFTPLMLAAIGAWILCVCVHEFSHALVAYIGGDRSVRERGYLSLDPLKFIDPVFSLLIPAIVLMLGGVPLPGGAVRIDESALRNRKWGAYVAAAGPASNLLLFLLFALPLHPRLGLVSFSTAYEPTWVYFCGAMAVLNFTAALFNLIPLPPLDGYRLIEHQLSEETQWKMRQPQTGMMTLGALFMVFIVFGDYAWIPFLRMLETVTGVLGFDARLMFRGYLVVLFNQSL